MGRRFLECYLWGACKTSCLFLFLVVLHGEEALERHRGLGCGGHCAVLMFWGRACGCGLVWICPVFEWDEHLYIWVGQNETK